MLMKQGLKMDHKKWEVIQQWSTPTCTKELQSFLGSVNYLSKFIPHLSDYRKPLQDLLKKYSEYSWVLEEAFIKLKSIIVKDMTLKYFYSSLPMYIETDASKKG